MDYNTLKILQNLPLEIKVAKTKLRLQDAYNWSLANDYSGIYISFSGGSDSLVLVDIATQLFPDVPIVFCNTGVEYPGIYKIVRSYKNKVNLISIRPDVKIKEVIDRWGYPLISKEVSQMVYELRNYNLTDEFRQKRLSQLPLKYHFLLDAPFSISNKCCYALKKYPFKKYEKESGMIPVIGLRADESQLRMQRYLTSGGCNAFNGARPMSLPIGFWTKSDVLEYLNLRKIPLAEEYGDIILTPSGSYTTSEMKSTGCSICLFGCLQEQEKGLNRLERMYLSPRAGHRNLWEYAMRSVDQGGLGYAEVCDFVGIRTKPRRKLF